MSTAERNLSNIARYSAFFAAYFSGIFIAFASAYASFAFGRYCSTTENLFVADLYSAWNFSKTGRYFFVTGPKKPAASLTAFVGSIAITACSACAFSLALSESLAGATDATPHKHISTIVFIALILFSFCRISMPPRAKKLRIKLQPIPSASLCI